MGKESKEHGVSVRDSAQAWGRGSKRGPDDGPNLASHSDSNDRPQSGSPDWTTQDPGEGGLHDGGLPYTVRVVNLQSAADWRRFTRLSQRKGSSSGVNLRRLSRMFNRKHAAADVLDVEGGNSQSEGGPPSEHDQPRVGLCSIIPLPVLNPFSKFAIAWYTLMCIVDATYSAFLVPLDLAFNESPQYLSWLSIIDFIAGALFWLDILVQFRTGFVVSYNLKRRLIMAPDLVAEFYLRHGTFWADLISALPVIAQVVVVATPSANRAYVLRVILVLRLLRLVRVIDVVKAAMFMSLTGSTRKWIGRKMSVGVLFLCAIFYMAMVVLNLLACVWYWIATLEGEQNSWLNGETVPLTDKNQARKWVAALYFVTLTITTVGYGDISPVTAAEELVTVVIMLLGVLIFGFIIGTSQELMKHVSKDARKVALLRRKLQAMEVWAERRQIPSEVRGKIRAYYSQAWVYHVELQDDSFFSELPTTLRGEMAFQLTRTVFERSEIFSVLNDEAKKVVAERLTPVSLAAGHDLCREGDDADELWILQEGELLAIRHTRDVEMLCAPGIVGETAILADVIDECKIRPVTFRAVSPCKLWALTLKDVVHIFKIYPELRAALVQAFKEHLQCAQQQDPHRKWGDMLDHVSQVQDESGALHKGEGSETGSVTSKSMMEPDAPIAALEMEGDDIHSESESPSNANTSHQGNFGRLADERRDQDEREGSHGPGRAHSHDGDATDSPKGSRRDAPQRGDEAEADDPQPAPPQQSGPGVAQRWAEGKLARRTGSQPPVKHSGFGGDQSAADRILQALARLPSKE
ncbi:hypothetical protein WJX72_007507 [[Myrmecia] bisecta]|uniref:Cyclic nucleotide-binding domain-containing protein n=1 Tax=[Myrmecia] bisecta TaxID=41462 RepID=A0AAW1Q408_9CHLO